MKKLYLIHNYSSETMKGLTMVKSSKKLFENVKKLYALRFWVIIMCFMQKIQSMSKNIKILHILALNGYVGLIRLNVAFIRNDFAEA